MWVVRMRDSGASSGLEQERLGAGVSILRPISVSTRNLEPPLAG